MSTLKTALFCNAVLSELPYCFVIVNVASRSIRNFYKTLGLYLEKIYNNHHIEIGNRRKTMVKKRIATLLIALATAILVVLALCFNMVEFDENWYESISDLKENGFEIMNGWELDEKIYYSEWCRIFNILMLLVGVGEIAVVGYMTYKKHEKLQSLLTTCVIINVILVTVYMINGFVLSREITHYYRPIWRRSYYTMTTKTHWPFILMVAAAIAYFAIEKKTKETCEPTVIYLKETEIADLLLKYKSLLDQGVITQEDYDKKKTELLN